MQRIPPSRKVEEESNSVSIPEKILARSDVEAGDWVEVKVETEGEKEGSIYLEPREKLQIPKILEFDKDVEEARSHYRKCDEKNIPVIYVRPSSHISDREGWCVEVNFATTEGFVLKKKAGKKIKTELAGEDLEYKLSDLQPKLYTSPGNRLAIFLEDKQSAKKAGEILSKYTLNRSFWERK